MKKSYRYGIELETFIDYERKNEFIEALRALPNRPWEISSDGSIRPDGDCYGLEIKCNGPKSYTTLEDNVKQLSKLCDIYNVQVNKSCGYHVHVSNKKFFNRSFIKKLTKFWIAIEDVLISTQPSSRLNNQYCKRKLREYVTKREIKLPAGKNDLIEIMGNQDRYYTLNYAALSAHGTLEVRLHAGTINAQKILNWVKLLIAIYDYCLDSYDSKVVEELFNMDISDEKIIKVFDTLAISKDLREFYTERIQKFMYTTLAAQQQAAKEIMKIKPQQEKLLARREVLDSTLQNVSNQIRRQLNNFPGGDY